MSPPTTAPIGESMPPTIIAGNATSAIAPIVGESAAGPAASVTPGERGQPGRDRPRDREHAPGADALGERGLLVEGGGAHRHAQRRRSGRRRRSPATTAAAMPSVHRSRTASTTSPTFTVSTPHGSARLRLSKPQIAVIACSMMNSRPIVIMITANTGSPTIWRSTVRSSAAPKAAEHMTASTTASANGSPAVFANA